MKKNTKAIIISAVIAIIGAFSFVAVTAKGVTYSPSISTTEMDTLSYTEFAKTMTSRAHQMTAVEYISNNITTKFFWLSIFKIWASMFVVSILSILITNKWCKN